MILPVCLWTFVAMLWLGLLVDLSQAVRGGRTVRSVLFSGSGVIRLAAAAVAPVAFAAGLPAEQVWPVAALAWTLRPVSTSPGLSQLAGVLATQAVALRTVMMLFAFVLVSAAVVLHAAEGAGQPEGFGTLPASLSWVLEGLVTDSFPEAKLATPVGKAMGTMVMCAGLGLFGLLTGILASGFEAEGRRRGFLEARGLLSRVPFLDGLGRGVVGDLAQALRRWDAPEDTVVCRRGQLGDSMYFVAQGEVEVVLGGANNPLLGEGRFFGEMALLDGSKRSADIITTCQTTLLVLHAADFHNIADRYPDLAQAIEAEATRRADHNAGISQ